MGLECVRLIGALVCLVFDAADAKKSVAPTTSAGTPTRPRGIRSVRLLRNVGSASMWATSGVSINVGATALTLTLY